MSFSLKPSVVKALSSPIPHAGGLSLGLHTPLLQTLLSKTPARPLFPIVAPVLQPLGAPLQRHGIKTCAPSHLPPSPSHHSKPGQLIRLATSLELVIPPFLYYLTTLSLDRLSNPNPHPCTPVMPSCLPCDPITPLVLDCLSSPALIFFSPFPGPVVSAACELQGYSLDNPAHWTCTLLSLPLGETAS